ncbi:uncharacterized protein [Miscanthus floridulus]|uniref:uncharacterized protein isoform X4 n=1 Tax=Miscanthus floridulus TaxID=154761 RepID=UPI0034594DC7
MVHQLEKEVDALKQRLHDYNREQLSLRVASKALDEKSEETLRKEFALSQKYHKELLRLKQNDYTKAHELLEHVYMDQQIPNTDASDSRSFCNLPVCAMAHTYFLLPYSGNKGLST